MDGIGRIILSRATKLRAVESLHGHFQEVAKFRFKLLVEPLKLCCLINTDVY